MRDATGGWLGARGLDGPGALVLLVLLTGCASAELPAGYEGRTGGAQVSDSRPQPAPSPAPSRPRVQPPTTGAPPPGPAKPGSVTGASARLLRIPAVILAMLLWPSTLEGELLARDWTNTLNPVTGMPWSSQEEHDQFWRLPQQERERLIQASRDAMGGSKPSAGSASTSPAGPRRHPNQTCEDSVLDHLQAEKDRICNAMPGASCSPAGSSAKRLARMPCSQIRLRIQALRNCITIRQFIQDECFGGVPDTPHERALNEHKSGLIHCLGLEAENCAPGHPMADL